MNGALYVCFGGAQKSFALFGLLNPHQHLKLALPERVIFNLAAQELQNSLGDLTVAACPNLADAAAIINKKPRGFWPVGLQHANASEDSKRQIIDLTLPISWGARWLAHAIGNDCEGEYAQQALNALWGLAGACDWHLEKEAVRYRKGVQLWDPPPIAEYLRKASQALARLGPVIMLTMPKEAAAAFSHPTNEACHATAA
ncbi:MAG: hypothetical protein ACTINM_04745 [Acetobacter cibinongensis]